jgi:dATP pyrophosphohydrolase
MTRVLCEIADAYVFRRRGNDADFLLLRRAIGETLGGIWATVAGRIEPGETAWQAALREIREETGLAPTNFYQIDAVNTFYMATDDAVHHCPCFAAEVPMNAIVQLNEEHDAFEWVDAQSAIQRFTWPGQRRAVREIIEEIVTPGPATPFLKIKIETK